ncbi:MAG: PhzF family phenazine biosynthesis protein [Acidobacteriota bacterium]
MKKRKFFIVDVFAEKKYSGNQLAVFLDAEDISKQEMQQIAKEVNYSETTFVLSNKNKSREYKVRIFTPEKEVPFAGHPTLGTAYVIQREIIKERTNEVILNLKAGNIPVAFNYRNNKPEILFMKQNCPVFGEIFDKHLVSRALSLKQDDIMEEFLIQEVSTGLPFIIVALKSLKAVKKAHVNKELFYEIIKDKDAKAVLIFCSETYHKKNDLNVRVFADYFGVPEDPATGSANGCLAGYLIEHDFFSRKKIDIKVEQGYEIGRPSRLYLRAQEKEGKTEVFVGGKVFLTAKGEFI